MKSIWSIFKRLKKDTAKQAKVEEIFNNYLRSQSALQQDLSKRPNGVEGSRILLVEDCPDQQRMTLNFLKKVGCEVELECNGDAAFLKVLHGNEQSTPFDIVIMDLYLIDSNGLESTIKIREIDAAVSIVGITAHVTPELENVWKAAGCDIFLAKPFTQKQLVDSLMFLRSKQLERGGIRATPSNA